MEYQAIEKIMDVVGITFKWIYTIFMILTLYAFLCVMLYILDKSGNLPQWTITPIGYGLGLWAIHAVKYIIKKNNNISLWK